MLHDLLYGPLVFIDVDQDKAGVVAGRFQVFPSCVVECFAGGLGEFTKLIRCDGDSLSRHMIFSHGRRRSSKARRHAVAIWSVLLQVLMRKRGDTAGYQRNCGREWGCQDTRHRLACPHVSEYVETMCAASTIYIVLVNVWYGCTIQGER
jgi:hypothetical protein